MITKSKQHKKSCELTDRDILLLKYIWKWKVLSSSAIARKFFPGVQVHGAYKRLTRLTSGKFIEPVDILGERNKVWGLTKKGFKRIRFLLKYLKKEGFRSANHDHDYLATAFHLGEWLTHQPEYTQTWSEHQLKCIPPEKWDDWVPKSTSHRPDGYSLYYRKESKVVVAFETELSIKTEDRYEKVVAFYDDQPSIVHVFWLVETEGNVNSLQRIFASYHVRSWSKHHFMLLKDFQKDGWYAPFVEGRFKGYSPIQFLSSTAVTIPSLGCLDSDTHQLLNSRKKPINSISPGEPYHSQKS